MQTYRFYFLGSDDHIKAVESIDCDDNAAAARTAASLLHQRREFAAVEVWVGKDLVHQARRGF